MQSHLSVHNITNVSATHSKGDGKTVLTMRFWNDESTQVVSVFFDDDVTDKKLVAALQTVVASTDEVCSA